MSGPLSVLLLLGALATDADVGRSTHDHGAEAVPAANSWDVFTNYGRYMPRVHCMRTAEGEPDWPWIILLLAFNVAIVAGYLRIFAFWKKCYFSELVTDRNRKLWQLALIFAVCATSGYLMSMVMFFWPAYRLLAVLLVVLTVITWAFALRLDGFAEAFTANRRQRVLNDELQDRNVELQSHAEELDATRNRLESSVVNLRATNEELDRFAYAASHDLKSPLRAIDHLSSWIEEDAGQQLPSEAREHLLMMRQRVRRMDSLLDDLLAYSRVGRTEDNVEPVDVGALLADIVALLDRPPGIEVIIEPPMPTLDTYRAPLRQVLLNLVNNAIKHHDREKGSVIVSCAEDGPFHRFAIADDGPGIEPGFHERVFELFQKLRPRDDVEGSGMGLSVVRKTIDTIGGMIRVESDGSRGTTFVVHWPTHISALDDEPEPAGAEPWRRKLPREG